MAGEEDIIYLFALSIALRYQGSANKKLVDYYGSAREVLSQSASELCRHKGMTPQLANDIKDPRTFDAAQKEMDWALSKNVRIIPFYSPQYPHLLSECPDAPALLFAVGPLNLNSGPFLSVVGTRSATIQGKEICRQLISGLVRLGHRPVIVSGLAYGIDSCAHRAALENSLATLAVLPVGVDQIYPAGHRSLAVDICRTGAVLSEFPSGTQGFRNNFLQRNRIIAGISQATLVVESKQDGGSLITAHFACDYGREVLAVPGRPCDSTSVGCNRLIHDNKASLVCSPEDLAFALGWSAPAPQSHPSLFDSLTDQEKRILSDIQEHGGHLSDICRRLKIPVPELSAILTQLELRGIVRVLPNKEYTLPI